MKSNIHKQKEIKKGIHPVWIKGKNVEQDNLIVSDKVEYYANHLMFYLKNELVFKVWLKKDYKNINEALKDVGIEVSKHD